ncbi:MAG TPA: Uma2 family endonuclease [Zeimonas sp.]
MPTVEAGPSGKGIRVRRAADVLLVIEVADSSLRYDRDVKLRYYAESGVPEVWIVDARRRELLVHREPAGTGYRNSRSLAEGETTVCAALPQLSVEVGELFAVRG